MGNAKFSIILPTYNRVKLLKRAVESVIAQSNNDWELIIVDDGSNDQTDEYIAELNHDQIIYKYQKNKGRSAARNLGISISSGDYICFLDSDDELLNDYLDIFSKMIDANQNEIYLTGVRLQSVNGYSAHIPKPEMSKHIIQCLEGVFNLMPFCFHKSYVQNDSFHSDLYYGEDFHFLIPIVLNNKVFIDTRESCVVHQHTERTINKVFLKIDESYDQLESAVLNTIDTNLEALSKLLPRKTRFYIESSKSRPWKSKCY